MYCSCSGPQENELLLWTGIFDKLAQNYSVRNFVWECKKIFKKLPFASASAIGGPDRKDISDMGKLGFWEELGSRYLFLWLGSHGRTPLILCLVIMSFWSLAAEKLGAGFSGWEELECWQDALYKAVKIQRLAGAVLASRAPGDFRGAQREVRRGGPPLWSWRQPELSALSMFESYSLLNNKVVTLLKYFQTTLGCRLFYAAPFEYS